MVLMYVCGTLGAMDAMMNVQGRRGISLAHYRRSCQTTSSTVLVTNFRKVRGHVAICSLLVESSGYGAGVPILVRCQPSHVLVDS